MKKTFATCAVLMALGMAKPALATSLGELFDGTNLVVDDLMFFGWELTYWDYHNPVYVPDYYAIEIVKLVDDPLNPGIRFEVNEQLFVDGIGYGEPEEPDLQLVFHYNVATVSQLPLIKDNSLYLADFLFEGREQGTPTNGGAIFISEYVYSENGQPVAEKFVNRDILFDSFMPADVRIFDPQSLLSVFTIIDIFGDYPDELVMLEAFEQRFSQVPEPTTMLLLGTGLVGVAGAARRKRKNQA